MTRLNAVENAIKELEGGKFQKLCNQYLYLKMKLDNISPLGSQEGTFKTTKGVPDSYIDHNNGTYTLIMYGTHQNVKAKIKGDIEDCLNDSKTKIPKEKIKEIICCHNSTNLTIPDIEELKKLGKGVPISIIGLGTLAEDIASPRFQNIAKEYLNLPYGTEQLFHINDFVEAYDKSAIVSPLNIEFKFRQTELKEINNLLQTNTAVLISGASGVGKTRIALEVCRYFEKDYEVFCVKSNGQMLYDDVKMALSRPGKYLLFLDDVNQMSDIQSIIDWLMLNMGSQSEVKVLATVRSYAKNKVVSMFNELGSSIELNIVAFKDSEIESIVDQCLGINNPSVQDQIAKIARGNVRIAILAGRLAIKDILRINNSTELFKNYYGHIIEDNGLSIEEVKSLFIVAFMNTVRIEKEDNFIDEIIAQFGLTRNLFKEVCYKLHQKELLDYYLEEIVKISDQSFSNYMLEYVLIERKLISVKKLIEFGFNRQKNRIIYTLNTLLQLFYSESTEKYLEDQINSQWEKMSVSEQDKYLESFCVFNPSRSLSCIKERIMQESTNVFQVTNPFFENNVNNQKIDSFEIGVLCQFRYSKYYEDAIGLALMLLDKRSDYFMDVYFMFTKYFAYDDRSYYEDYQRENMLIEKIWNFKGIENYNRKFLLLKVIDSLLETSVSSTRLSSDGRSVNLFKFKIILTKGQRQLRKDAWEVLAILYNEDMFKNEIESILMELSRYKVEDENTINLFKYDITCIESEFISNWDLLTFTECLILSKIAQYAEKLGIKLQDNLYEYQDNEYYQIYQMIAFRKSSDNHIESTLQRASEIQEKTKSFSREHYFKLVQVAAIVESYKNINTYQIGYNLSIALENVASNLLIDVVTDYLAIGAPFATSCTVIVKKLKLMIGFKETYNLIQKSDFIYKNYWIRFLFDDTLDSTDLNNEVADMLLSFLNDQDNEEYPCFPQLKTIFKFDQINPRLLHVACENVMKVSEKNKNAIGDFLFEYDEPNKLVDDFSDSLDDLEILFMDPDKLNFEYDGRFISAIVEKDIDFWKTYLQKLISANYFELESNNLFKSIWELNNYKIYIDIAYEQLISNSERYTHNRWFSLIFSVDDKNELINKRINEWITYYIQTNNEDTDLMHDLFFYFISNQSVPSRIYYISVFLSFNNHLSDFKKLAVTPTQAEWTGSEVPFIDHQIDFINNLIKEPFLNGLEFMEHRLNLSDRVAALEKYKRKIQLQEFEENIIN